jgi:hypothetical protein
MSDENNSIESLIKGGLVGAALGSLISNDKEEGAIFGALLGAAIAATLNAGEEARKTKLPLFVEEAGELYELSPNGNKRFIRKIEKPTQHFPEKFKLQ